MTEHRKRVKSYNLPGHAHELTYSCFRRLPLLNRDRTRTWCIEAMRKARVRCRLHIWAYVVMPEHVHILVWPQRPDYKISLIRTALKTHVQRQALAYLRGHAPDFLKELRDEQPSGEVHYRFWQRGGGYDRNVIEPATLERMIDYIHQNPVRRGLVTTATDWLWSSARFYAGLEDVKLNMDSVPWLNG